jgi:hypothetical protein
MSNQEQSVRSILNVLSIQCSDNNVLISNTRDTSKNFLNTLKTEITDPQILDKLLDSFQPLDIMLITLSSSINTILFTLSNLFKLIGFEILKTTADEISQGDGSSPSSTSETTNSVRSEIHRISDLNIGATNGVMVLSVDIKVVKDSIVSSSLSQNEKDEILVQLLTLDGIVADQKIILSQQRASINKALSSL